MAVLGLCEAQGLAATDPVGARRAFFDRSHDTLHAIARALQDVDRSRSARLLTAKNRVEQDFEGGAGAGSQLAADLASLLDEARAGLERISIPAPRCL